MPMESFLKEAVEKYLQQTTSSNSSLCDNENESGVDLNATTMTTSAAAGPTSGIATPSSKQSRPLPVDDYLSTVEKSEGERKQKSIAPADASQIRDTNGISTPQNSTKEQKNGGQRKNNKNSNGKAKVAVNIDRRVPLLLCPYKKIDITETHAKATYPYRRLVVMPDNNTTQGGEADIKRWKKELGDLYDKCIKAGREAYDKRFTSMAKELSWKCKEDYAYSVGNRGRDIQGYHGFQEYVLHPDFHQDPTIQLQHLEKIIIFLRRLRIEQEWLELEVSNFCKTVGKYGITVCGDKLFEGNRTLGVQRTSDGFVKTLFKKGHLDHQIEPLKKKLRRKYGVWFVKQLNTNLEKNNSAFETKEVVAGGVCMGYIMRPAVLTNTTSIPSTVKHLTGEMRELGGDDTTAVAATAEVGATGDDLANSASTTKNHPAVDVASSFTAFAAVTTNTKELFSSKNDEEFLKSVQEEMERRGMSQLANYVSDQLQKRSNYSSINVLAPSKSEVTNERAQLMQVKKRKRNETDQHLQNRT